MPRKPCRDPFCSQLVDEDATYCRDHESMAEEIYRRRGNRKLYATKRWRLLRRRVLAEEQICGCGSLTEEVDHIVPVEDGGMFWSRSNLQGVCHRCHSRKTAADVRAREFS